MNIDVNVKLKECISLDTPICQYMRLDYFISLLKTSKYSVRPRCGFSDAYEQTLPLGRLFRLREPGKPVNPIELREDLNRTSELMRTNRENGRLLASCWCMQPPENILMWNCYAQKIGVCVKSTIGRFSSAFNLINYEIVCGKMNYDGYSHYTTDLCFTKDPGYACEEEYRFYFIPTEQSLQNGKTATKPIKIEVDLTKLIDRVVLSPYIDPCASNEICGMIKDRYGISVSRSQLNERG